MSLFKQEYYIEKRTENNTAFSIHQNHNITIVIQSNLHQEFKMYQSI